MSVPGIPLLIVGHWAVSVSVCAGTAAAGLLYLGTTTRVRNWPVQRTLAFLLGLVVLFIALDSGLERYDDTLLSVHMTQHLLLIDLAPPLLLCGRPALLALRSLPKRPRRGLGRGLVRLGRLTPAPVCLSLYVLLVLVWHLPALFTAAIRDPVLHELEHASFLLAGLALWWPLLGNHNWSRRLDGMAQLPYLVIAMAPMVLIGVYLDTATSLLYPIYSHPAQLAGVSALADQHQAGGIMWVVGTTFMTWTGLASIRSALLHAERRQQERDRAAGLLGGLPR